MLAVAVLSGLAAVPGAVADGAPDPAVVGRFSAPIAEDPTFATRPPATPEESKLYPPAVGMAMTPSGQVVYWGGLTNIEDSNPGLTFDGGRVARPSPSRVLDLRNGTPVWSEPGNTTGGPGADDDFFCGDLRVTSDGRVMVVGGSLWRSDPVDLSPLHPVTEPVTGPGFGGTAEIFGSNATRWYDERTASWQGTDANRMNVGRWYPTLLTLPDGKEFVASGVERLVYNTKGLNVHETETFDPSTNTWTLNPESANASLPLFARLLLTHDGKVLYTGAGQMWSPFGQAADEALWNMQSVYDPQTQSWSYTGLGTFGARSGAFTVPLMFKAPYDETKIVVGGGNLGVSPGTYVANDLTEILTYKDGKTTNVRGPDLNNRRWYSSGVLLPTGEVLAFSGADKDEVIQPGSETAVRQAELFDGERWIPLASGARDRTYHNSAILLPDGRVLVGGHAPINNGYGKPDNTTYDRGLTANNLKDPSFEIYEPPYLFKGPRPVLDYAPSGIGYGGSSLFAATPGSDVAKLVLMRLPSTTHVTDADQRGIELPVEVVGSTIMAANPPSGAVAPPGFYYAFAVSSDGVPSKARIVKVGSPNLVPASAPFGA